MGALLSLATCKTLCGVLATNIDNLEDSFGMSHQTIKKGWVTSFQRDGWTNFWRLHILHNMFCALSQMGYIQKTKLRKIPFLCH